MKYVVSSSLLLEHCQAISRVINSKNTIPILDNFLFNLEANTLTITASDLETTLITTIDLDNSEGEGKITVPAKILTDTLKEFPEQPLTFEINLETSGIDIFSENGKFSIIGQDADDYPTPSSIEEGSESTKTLLSPKVLLTGIDKCIFAITEDELRPVMNGVFFEMTTDSMNFVASDSHKLVRYRRYDIKSEENASFILPKKPANLLKGVLGKEENDVTVEFNASNAFFTLSKYKMICRLIEGKYPNYESVIPAYNPNKLIIDRGEMRDSLRRVSVYSNQASNLVRLAINEGQLIVSAQDIDFSISAHERLTCQHEGEDIEIGFKSNFLLDILNAMDSVDVALEMTDSSKAGIFTPVDKEDDQEDILMLLMPIMV